MLPLSMMLLLICGSDLVNLKTYEEPKGEEYLSLPHASCFGDQGELYVMDPSQPRILVWDAKGHFVRGIGKKGEGPGELDEPIQVTSKAGKLYVWQRNGRLTRYSRDGKYEDNFTIVGPWPRRFAMLDQDRAFINHREIDGSMEGYYTFDIRHRDGSVEKIKKDLNPGFMKIKPGSNNAEIRAYMADVDIQADPAGGYWYGFGYEKTLYHMNAKGKPDGKRSFDLPAVKISDEDRERVENKEVVVSNGRRIRAKDLPNLKFRFDFDKAHFSHFLVKGQKVAFVTTTLGGSDGTGDGDSVGSYFICDLKTGKLLARGAYELPQDSQVHYRDGRIMAFEAGDDGYEVREVSLKGL